jgi:hypothetical protein
MALASAGLREIPANALSASGEAVWEDGGGSFKEFFRHTIGAV